MHSESTMLGSVVHRDLSTAVNDALNSGLPNEGLDLVSHVEITRGWGDIHFVSICSGIRQRDAGDRLEETVHKIVGSVLHGRRHVVQIKWAT